MPPTVKPVAVRDGRLRLRVGGEDRLRRVAAAVCRERSGRGDEALLDPLERQRRTDHAGREHEHLLRHEPEQRSGARGSRGGVGVALGAGRGVRDAGVDHDRLRLRDREVALRHGHRRSLDAVLRPHRGARRGRH